MAGGFSAGICPRCEEHLLLKQGLMFLVCPLCATNLGAQESRDTLELVYSNPAAVTENIAKVLTLEKKYGPHLPYQILLVMRKHFPHNEEIAFLTLKMSGYSSFVLKEYLTNFARVPKPVAFAEEVLENGLIPRNWELTHLFEQYIKSKTSGLVHTRWLDKLREMNASIAANPPSNTANQLIFAFYIASSIINIIVVMAFILFSIPLTISIFIGVSLLCLEMAILYRHARKYGGRLTIADTERALMVLFMCSIVLVVGGTIVGALVTIW